MSWAKNLGSNYDTHTHTHDTDVTKEGLIEAADWHHFLFL